MQFDFQKFGACYRVGIVIRINAFFLTSRGCYRIPIAILSMNFSQIKMVYRVVSRAATRKNVLQLAAISGTFLLTHLLDVALDLKKK